MAEETMRHGESQISYHRRRLRELNGVRGSWEALWQDLADYLEPTRLRLNGQKEGARSRAKIMDSTGTIALRTLASGMHSGITSPARPWFRLSVGDKDLKDYAPVKLYLEQVETRMREIFSASNIYPSFHLGYVDLGLFGQSCALLVEDEKNVMRMQQLTHGSFWLSRDVSGAATTLYRVFSWNVARIIERFGLDNVSDSVRGAYERGDYDKVFEIGHAIEPRIDRDERRLTKRHKRFLSNYWEMEGASGRLLEESGFDENPIIAPTWALLGEDHYSTSPAQIALADVKMLQHEQKRKWEAIDMIVNPPMVAPSSLRGARKAILPGEITYVDEMGGAAYRPALEINLRISELAGDIRETSERINRALFADLFLMLENMEGVQPRTTFELAERKEEKLLALGPVLENIYGGQLDPVIDRAFEIMGRRGLLPDAPEELRGRELDIEYVSMLAQAQKAVSTGAIERVAGFIGGLSSAKPEALDKLNVDGTINKYVELLGAPASILVDDEAVMKMREARAAAAEQASQMQQAAALVPVMKQSAEAAGVMADVADSPAGAGLLEQIGVL